MLKFSVRRSARLAWLLLAGHAAAMALLWPLAVPLWIQALAALAVIASLAFLLTSAAWLKTPRAVVAVEIRDSGEIAVQTREGEWHECRLSGDSFVSPWLTILALRSADRRTARYVVLAPDNVDAEDYRRLRVWLRWAGKREAEPG